jgi:hypothetical protein
MTVTSIVVDAMRIPASARRLCTSRVSSSVATRDVRTEIANRVDSSM